MNGAESVLRTLAASGVEVCFANPGTSEMHLVAAMDRVPEVRGVLTLFEGVASAAADGYARMAGKPAATLLHLGPGFGNAFANVHNAYKARTPMVNLVGDHAVLHRPLGAPLTSDVEAIAGPASHWLRSARDAREAATLAAEAVAAARRGGVATLVLPADAGWDESLGPAEPRGIQYLSLEPGAYKGIASALGPPAVPDEAVEVTARALRSGKAALLLGGVTTGERGLRAAARIAAGTGAAVFHDTFTPRLARGGARPRARLLPYLTELAVDALSGLRAPDRRRHAPARRLLRLPRQAEPAVVAGDRGDRARHARGGRARPRWKRSRTWSAPSPRRWSRSSGRSCPTGGALDLVTLTAAVGALLPDNAVVVDEAVTASALFQERTAGAGEHDYLFLTGGAIGWGLPAATGAAIGAPERPVFNVQADGSAMYTIQSLWTQAREELDVTTIIVANRSYAILEFEFSRVGAEGDGTAARALMDIGRPELDFAALARAQGVPGRRVDDVPGLIDALREAVAEPGPHLIEALV